MAAPAGAVPVSPIDLSQLCGAGDCVVSTNKTIGSASGPLEVGGNFTLSPGVVLEFRVPVHIKVAGNMVLSGTVGAPGHGGDGGSGGDAGQTGGAGGDAPAVVDGIFDVQGSITLSSTAVAVADGGSGGSGGLAGLGQTVGGAGGAGGKAGSLTFNACTSFTSVAGARVLVNGGPGGIGQAGALGGAGGAGGSFIVSAGQAIVVNAPIAALGGDGGNGGAGAGPNGAVGSVTLRASGPITVGSGTLDAGVRTSVSPFQSSVAALSFCAAAEPMPVPTLSEWAMVLLLSLIALFSIGQLRRKYASRATSKSGF